MNYAYKTDGTVTGYNRKSIPNTDELTGNCNPQDWTVQPEKYNKDTRCYLAPGGSLVAKNQSEVDDIIAADLKSTAYLEAIDSVEKTKEAENLKDFPYDGESYVSDQNSIQATQNDCLASEPSDKLNTLRGTLYEGCWAVKDGFIAHTASSFILLAREYFKRGSDNFTTRSNHLVELGKLNSDSSKTAQDILNYDYSTGWH